MRLRHAEFADLDLLLPLAHKAHKQSIFRDCEMNEAILQRNFVVAMEFDNGYAKVAEDKDGEVIGGLVGMISMNSFGVECAQDLFCYSRGGTDDLIRDFVRWAKVRGVQFVQMTDLSLGDRYQQLCKSLGFETSGVNFAKVIKWEQPRP